MKRAHIVDLDANGNAGATVAVVFAQVQHRIAARDLHVSTKDTVRDPR
jgi:hypothetical protein